MSVVAIVSDPQDAVAITRWGWRFASARHLELQVFIVSEGPGDVVSEPVDVHDEEAHQHELVAPVLSTLLEVTRDVSQRTGDTEEEVRTTFEPRLTCIRGQELYDEVRKQVRKLRARLVLIANHQGLRAQNAQTDLIRRIFLDMPCDTVLIRPGQSQGTRCERLLVPAAGGPHSIVALQWSLDMAMEYDGKLTPLFVHMDTELAEDVGHVRLKNILSQARVEVNSWVQPKVAVSDDVRQAISDEAEQGYDMLLVGASDRGAMQRLLFGTLPSRLLSGPNAMAIAVVRHASPWSRRVREAVELWLDLRIPQLERDARISLLDRLETGSRWNFDFMALMCLATSIAALGLIQSSTAVVIGAMLVAPLMTPLIACGLSLVQGNLPLVKNALRSVGYGFILALGIGVLCGLLSPLRQMTGELAARGAPTLLDLGVAFISGVAAAYSMARPNLSAALPGVAIAAALVPPLATTGISLAFLEFHNARGAALLFATNVVVIILGAACTFYACGIRGNRKHGQKRLWVHRTMLGLLLAAGVLAVPLASVLMSQAFNQEPPVRLTRKVVDAIRSHVGDGSATRYRLLDARVVLERGEAILELRVRSPEPLDEMYVDALAALAARELQRPIRLRVLTELVRETEGGR